MLLRYSLLGLTLICLMTEGSTLNKKPKDEAKIQESKKDTKPVNVSAPTKKNTFIAPRSVNARAPAQALPMTREEKQRRISELSDDVASIIAEDILVASESLKKQGSQLSANAASDFFQTVAQSTLYRIEESIKALSILVEDRDKVSKEIAQKIAKEAANRGFTKLNEEGNLDSNIIDGGVVGIPKIAEEFIKMALQGDK